MTISERHDPKFSLQFDRYYEPADTLEQHFMNIADPFQSAFEMLPGSYGGELRFSNFDVPLTYWDAITEIPGVILVYVDEKALALNKQPYEFHVMNWQDAQNVKHYCEAMPDRAAEIKKADVEQKNMLNKLGVTDLRLMAASLICSKLLKEQAITEEEAVEQMIQTADAISQENKGDDQIKLDDDAAKALLRKASVAIETRPSKGTLTR